MKKMMMALVVLSVVMHVGCVKTESNYEFAKKLNDDAAINNSDNQQGPQKPKNTTEISDLKNVDFAGSLTLQSETGPMGGFSKKTFVGRQLSGLSAAVEYIDEVVVDDFSDPVATKIGAVLDLKCGNYSQGQKIDSNGIQQSIPNITIPFYFDFGEIQKLINSNKIIKKETITVGKKKKLNCNKYSAKHTYWSPAGTGTDAVYNLWICEGVPLTGVAKVEESLAGESFETYTIVLEN